MTQTLPLSKEDRHILELEIANSSKARKNRIRFCVIWVFISVIGFLYFFSTNFKADMTFWLFFSTLMSFTFLYFNFTLYAKAIHHLKKDLDNNIKYVGNSRIMKIKGGHIELENGIKMGTLDLTQKGKLRKGEVMIFELTPIEKYFFVAHIHQP